MNHNHSTLSDEQALVQGLAESDEKIFSKLYDKFSAALYCKIYNWVHDAGMAENLLQDVFTKAWRSRHLYDESKGRLFTWLYNMSRNICIDYYRSKGRRKTKAALLCEDVNLLIGERESSIPATDTIGLRKLVDKLRKEESEIIDLMYFKGFTQLEISQSLNMPLGTVKTRVTMAIKKLRQFFMNEEQIVLDMASAN